jgi:hypothetical protein
VTAKIGFAKIIDRKLNLLDEYEKFAILEDGKLLLIKLKVSSLKSMLMNIHLVEKDRK